MGGCALETDPDPIVASEGGAGEGATGLMVSRSLLIGFGVAAV